MYYRNLIFDRLVDHGFAEKNINYCLEQTSEKVALPVSRVSQVIFLSETFSRESLEKEYGFREFVLFKKVFEHKDDIKEMLRRFIYKPTNVSQCVRDYFWAAFWNMVEKQERSVSTLRRLRDIYVGKKPDARGTGRTDSRIRDIEGWLQHFDNTSSPRILYIYSEKNDEALLSAIATRMSIDLNCVSSVDIQDNTKLPFNEETFDLVLAFQSLHTKTDPHPTLIEIHRVLKNRGRLIIREHDVRDKATEAFLDMVNALYSTVFNAEKTPSEFRDTYSSRYRSKEDWSKRITSQSFAFQGISYGSGKRGKDMFCSYYANYQKV